jgi:hypothetical protein
MSNNQSHRLKTAINERFLPHADHANALREAMTENWRSQLKRQLDERSKQVHFPTATPPTQWFVSGLDYGAFYDLCLAPRVEESVEATLAGEAAFRWLQRRFSGEQPALAPPGELQVSTLSELFYGRSEILRFQRWFEAGAQQTLAMEGIGASRLMRATRDLREAWIVLGKVSPELLAEVAILSPEVLLVRSSQTDKPPLHSFSSPYLWGCMALNTETHLDMWDYFCSLVRESASNRLFALAPRQAIFFNPLDERGDAVTRNQANRTEQAFHTALTSAREVLALRHAAEYSGPLPGDVLDSARTRLHQQMQQSERKFFALNKQLVQNGCLSETGAAMLHEARAQISPTPSAVLLPSFLASVF